jgi:hypothetical protein
MEYFVDFEMFNFFYCSHLPFFNASAQPPIFSTEVNLSLHVLNLDDSDASKLRFEEPDFKADDSMLAVRRQICEILDAAVCFWQLCVSDLSCAIHASVERKRWDGSTRMHAFFISPIRIKNEFHQLRLNRDAPLTIQYFATVLHPYWYWFHFKYITMPRIVSLCGQYDKKIKTISVRGATLWNHWARLFNASVRALGAEARRDGVRGNVRALLQSANALRARTI